MFGGGYSTATTLPSEIKIVAVNGGAAALTVSTVIGWVVELHHPVNEALVDTGSCTCCWKRG